MSVSKSDLDPKLEQLVWPYFGEARPVCPSAYLVADLGVTGSDYLDFVGDVEKTFRVDLEPFLIGDDPKYVSAGLAGMLTGERRKPVFRDFTIAELNDFLSSRHTRREG
ncbi:MAG TPA: hypothetical protein VFO12_11250 [Sphingomicrobium sp.]|nr:hypothetical protein [Sphingomicrobium sp.]